MQKNIHPDNYRTVLFYDSSAKTGFLIRSCAQTSKTMQWEDGNTYPVYYCDTSAASHPFYTGQRRTNNLEGKVSEFNNRFGQFKLTGKK